MTVWFGLGLGSTRDPTMQGTEHTRLYGRAISLAFDLQFLSPSDKVDKSGTGFKAHIIELFLFGDQHYSIPL